MLPHRIEVRAVGANAREVVLELTREIGFLDEEDSAASNEEFVACLRFGSCMDEMSRWSVIKAVASAVGEGGAVSEEGLAEALQESGYVECGRLTLECHP